MNLHALAGNGALKRHLELETARRGLSHAYILTGPAGSGKRTLAGLLSAALVCADDTPPCGHCPGCKKAMAGIHPDVITVGADGKDVTVAQVRALRSDAYIRPNEAQRKVYVIQNAQSMNPSAQNAMLKLLEDGPAYAAFLLLSENAAALLPTVRSRCESLALSPLEEPEGLALLTQRCSDKSPAQRETAWRMSGGFLGQALYALEGEGPSPAQAAANELFARLEQGDELALAEYCVGLESWERDRFSALLDALIARVRAALVEGTSSLPTRRLLETVDTAEGLRSACGFNVGTGHLPLWLCAALSSKL